VQAHGIIFRIVQGKVEELKIRHLAKAGGYVTKKFWQGLMPDNEVRHL
jgi:hypothetical protein